MALLDQGEAVVLGLLKNLTLYVGLCENEPGEDDTLETITELTDSGYSRKQITLGDVGTDEQGTFITNSNDIAFGPFSSGHNISYYFITDVETGTEGNLIFGGQLQQTKSVGAGDSLVIPAGSLKIYAS